MADQPTGYKRSWKNLLLNKRYQLRFTLFMVGLSAVLMAGLGIWVMKEANEATTVAMARVRGEACPKIPSSPTSRRPTTARVPMKLDDDGSDDAAARADAPAEPAPVGRRRRRRSIRRTSRSTTRRPMCSPSKPLWCTERRVQAGDGRAAAIKAKDCDAYVKDKLEDADAVEALRKATIPVVKCDGGQTFTRRRRASPSATSRSRSTRAR